MKSPPLPITCPQCGGSNSVACTGKRHFLYPLAYAIFLPLDISLSHQLQSPTGYHCQTCDRAFKRRSRIAKAVGVPLLILSLILTLLYMFLPTLIWLAKRQPSQ